MENRMLNKIRSFYSSKNILL